MTETFVFFSVVLLGFRLIMAAGTFTVNCSETVIMGKYGSSVVLPCWLTPETDAEGLEIRWYRPGQFKSPILFYQNKKPITDLQEMYKNRSSLTTRNSQSAGLKQGDVSLRLDNLALSDIGIFHCYVSGDTSYEDRTLKLNLTALGSSPHLSLEHYRDSVNLSCSSCGWFPRPRLLWKTPKGDALSDPQSPIYSEQQKGLFCVYNWVILPSSVSNKIICSVLLSEEEKRNVNLDLGAKYSVDNSVVWKILFTLLLLCLLALIGLFLYRKYKPGYKAVSTDDSATKMENLRKSADDSATIMENLRKSAVHITFDKENCKKDYLIFNPQGDIVRDHESAAEKYKGCGFPYELCVHGIPTLKKTSYWEVGLSQNNISPKTSWLIGVAKASYSTSDLKSDLTPSNGFLFLCSDSGNLHVNTKPEISLLVNPPLEHVGVLLDFEKNKLEFYNARDGVCLFTMRVNFQEEIVPLFNPGIGDKAPLKIINLQDQTSASDQAVDENQPV